MSKRTPLALVAAAGAVVLTTAAATVTAPLRVSGPTPYAACTVGGPGTNYLDAEVEPSVSVNPADTRQVVGAWQQDRWADGGAHGLVAGSSRDGGLTWLETPLPFSACAPGGARYERASDPWVSFGPDGTAYANAISFDQSTPRNAVTAATSSDGGQTWTNLATLQSFDTAAFFTDKNSVTADPLRTGVAYSVWDTLQTPMSNPRAALFTAAYSGPGYLSMTTDGGRHWSAPRVIFPTGTRQQTIGNQIVVDRVHPGTLYDVANWIQPPNSVTMTHSTVAFVKSTDGGRTWSAPRVIAQLQSVGVTDPNTGAAVRTGDIIPEPAIDPVTGTLHVVWQDARFSGGLYDTVAMSSSSDGGLTWSAPVEVSTRTGRPAFTPSIAVAADGTVGLTYYDFRNLAAGNSTTLPTDYWFSSSRDGFVADSHIAGPFDMMTAPNARGLFVGDYEGLAAAGAAFRSLYVATNSGNTANRTDVFTTAITP
ncbi:MAG TPA: sialidase family protein [Intrasporangium sp.]|uniref:sialidase family protein n=1 Tax=Intrasporangium sp. TaxID=1925024 RepID=UPI002D79E367|nr:sialidase family protein [Intrasporangium sp.]HET7399502.1 sialidase family protein [Intrasporangium sp.]